MANKVQYTTYIHTGSALIYVIGRIQLVLLFPWHILKFLRGKYLWFCQVLLKSKFSWSNFQPRLASVMNLIFYGRKVLRLFSDLWNPWKFSTSKILGYTVWYPNMHVCSSMLVPSLTIHAQFLFPLQWELILVQLADHYLTSTTSQTTVEKTHLSSANSRSTSCCITVFSCY